MTTTKCNYIGLFIYSQSALHVSGDVFAHHQEHVNVFTTPFHLIHDTSRQQRRSTLPEAVNIVTCSWW